MTCIEKWKLGLILDEKEAKIVLNELYEGAGKTLVFDATSKLNPILLELYENFPANKEYKTILRFTEKECKKPYLSLIKQDTHYSHIIFTQNYTIYIYD